MNFSDFDEIVKFAIQREDEAAEGYGSLKDKAKSQALKKLLGDLQNEERKHKELLEDIDKSKLGNYEIKAVPDLKISDYLVEEPMKDDINFQDLLIFAAKKEQKAVELYSVMRDSVGEPELKKLFEYLIEQEKQHKLKLETEYEKNVYQDY